MNIIFQINGGCGKCVMATAVCEAIKKQYPEDNLIVISGYSDVFLNNPHVHRAFSFGNISYFYDEYVNGKELLILAHDPYLETSHIKEEKNLIETWCELFKVPYNNEQPRIYLNDREIGFFKNKFQSDKPIFLLQTNGGALVDQKYCWARDIPSSVAVQIIDAFKDEYNIVHIRRDDQMTFANTTPVMDSFRSLCVLTALSSKRLFMDSCSQHTAAAMGMPSTVCWIGTNPDVFGYAMHDNIKANPFTVKPELKYSFLQKFNISGDLLEFPYNNESEIFDVKKIIKSLKTN
jgi:hypothetical protein